MHRASVAGSVDATGVLLRGGVGIADRMGVVGLRERVVSVALGLALAVAVARGVRLALAVSDALGLRVGVGVGLPLGVGVGRIVGTLVDRAAHVVCSAASAVLLAVFSSASRLWAIRRAAVSWARVCA
jgi:hypothetical protein